MTKYLIAIAMLFTGIGTVPAVVFLYIMLVNEEKDLEKRRKDLQ